MQALVGPCKASAMFVSVTNQASKRWRVNIPWSSISDNPPTNCSNNLTDEAASAHENVCLLGSV